MHQRLSGNSQLTWVHFTHVYSTLIVLKAERFTEAKQENSDYTKYYLQLQWNNRETKLLSLQKSSNCNNLYIFLTITRKREEKQICYTLKGLLYWILKFYHGLTLGQKIFKIFGRIERKVVGWGGSQTCICYPTVNYLRSSALISSPTAWSLLFMKGNRLENEKFFFFFSFAFICCTFPFVCDQKMEDACTGNFFFTSNGSI